MDGNEINGISKRGVIIQIVRSFNLVNRKKKYIVVCKRKRKALRLVSPQESRLESVIDIAASKQVHLVLTERLAAPTL